MPATAGSLDAPFFAALGAGAFGDMTGDGCPSTSRRPGASASSSTSRRRRARARAHHQISAWNPRTGDLLPAFPRFMDDMQFLDVAGDRGRDGDGMAEVIQGSGGYLLRAYSVDGASPRAGRSSRTAGSSPRPSPGDIDGDGMLEVVAATREGNFYVWETPAPAGAGSVQWQGFGATAATPRTGLQPRHSPSPGPVSRAGDPS